MAYLNSLTPVRHALPRSEIKFPVNLLVKGAPRPAGSVAPPDRGDRTKYGEYLVRMGGCLDCHTPLEKGQPDKERLLAGGREFRMPFGVVVSANITPHDTGIGPWSEKQFIDKFGEYKEYVKSGPPKAGPENFTLMPWLNFAQLPDEDLGAIFTYLRTQKPVRNNVDSHPGYQKATKPPSPPQG